MNKDNYLKIYACICFRDIADEDYVLSRLAFKHRFIHGFWWNAQQSIEKYLKCILLLNTHKINHLGHDLNKAVKIIEKKCKFVKLSQSTKDFISTVNSMGDPGSRYFEKSLHMISPNLEQLDRTIFDIRKFAVVDKVKNT